MSGEISDQAQATRTKNGPGEPAGAIDDIVSRACRRVGESTWPCRVTSQPQRPPFFIFPWHQNDAQAPGRVRAVKIVTGTGPLSPAPAAVTSSPRLLPPGV